MKKFAEEIFNQYKTRNPFEIAKATGILIVSEPLGNIYGYYDNRSGQKFIHVNDELPPYYRRHIVASLLYQSFVNPNEMLFIKRKEAALFTETEKQAYKFSTQLIIPEDFDELDLTEEDRADLFQRLNRVWGDAAGTTLESQLRYVLDRVNEM